MTLSYLLASIRRFWYLPVIGFVLLGLLAAITASGRVASYESATSVLIQRPAGAEGTSASGTTAEYVNRQPGLMTSADVSEAVAAEIPDLSAGEAFDMVSTRVIQADQIIILSATSTDPELAALVANTYVEKYFEDEIARNQSEFAADIAALEDNIDRLDSEIEVKQAELAQIPTQNTTAAQRLLTITLQSELATLQGQRSDDLRTVTDLERSLSDQVLHEVLGRAQVPTAPLGASSAMITAAGAFVGAVLGLVGAVLLSMTSSRVLDEVQLSELTDIESIGSIGKVRPWRRNHERVLDGVPASSADVVNRLCVRAESFAPASNRPLKVAVVGTERGSGTTTTALAMAHQFHAAGVRTLIVDGDTVDSEITRSYSGNGVPAGGIPSLLSLHSWCVRNNVPKLERQALDGVIAHTQQSRVRVLGTGPEGQDRPLSRSNVSQLVEATNLTPAEVVIIDGGPLLESASTLRLCPLADAVVIAVPLGKQKIEPLGAINQALEPFRDRSMLVVTPARS